MKKRILTALLAILMLSASLSCLGEDIYPVTEFDLDAYGENGGMMIFTYSDGSTEESGGWGVYAELNRDGMTIGDVLADGGLVSIEPVCEGDVFEGWLAYELAITTDANGFEEYAYIPVSDALYTTEELLALPAPDYRAVYAAKWESIPAENYFQPIEEETVYMASATLYAGGGVLTFQGEEEAYESELSVATTEIGQTVGEALGLDALTSVSMEGAEFTGWTVYDVAYMESGETAVEAEGALAFPIWEDWITTLLDYTVCAENISTEELAQLVCGDTDLFIVANWA